MEPMTAREKLERLDDIALRYHYGEVTIYPRHGLNPYIIAELGDAEPTVSTLVYNRYNAKAAIINAILEDDPLYMHCDDPE